MWGRSNRRRYFCPECGFNLKTSEKSETTNGGSKMKKLGIIIGILVIIGIILVIPVQTKETYYEKEPYTVEEPYTVTEDHSETLIDDTYTVSAGYYKAIPIYILNFAT